MSKTPAAGINDQADDMTPDELEALARRSGAATTQDDETGTTAASSTSGAADTGDDDTAAADAAGTGTDTTGAAPGDTTTAAAAQEAAAEVAPPAGPQLLDVPDVAALTEQRKAITAKRAEVEKKWEDGEIDDDARASALEAIDGELFDLASKVGAANALQEFNRQAVLREQTKKLDELRAAGSKAGLNYADPTVADDFDAMLQRVASRPEFAGKGFSELADEAHRRVMALHGKLTADAAPPPAAAAPAARPNPRDAALPVLSSLPPAGQPVVGNTLVEELAAIEDPDALEARIAAMSPAQRAQLTRSTMPV